MASTQGSITDALKTDISLNGDMLVSPGGDLVLVSGLQNLQQALWHRLITIPGTLVHKPTYGIGVQAFQNDLNSFANQQKLTTLIQDQFSQDPRVQSVNSVSFFNTDLEPELIQINVNITVVGYTEQPMTFTPFSGVG